MVRIPRHVPAVALLQFVTEEAADAFVPAEQPVVGSDPQVAQRVVQQADAVPDALSLAVPGVEPREALVPRVEKHEGFGAPQPDADSVRMGADDVDVEVLAGERRAENVEAVAVEAVEPVLRGEPHVAPAVLTDVLHAVVGQPVSCIVPPVGIDRRPGKGCRQEQDQSRYVVFVIGKASD